MKKETTLLLIALLLATFGTLSAQQWGDYTLYSTQNGSNAYLIDTSGVTYHTWTFAANKKTGYSSYLLPGGTIVRSVANQGNALNGGGMTGAVQKADYNGTILWDFVYSSATYCLHHDICPLPNGNVLMISYEVKTAAEATQAGCSQNMVIWSEKIIEVQPTGATTGTIVWEWHAWDHLVQNANAAKDNYYATIVDHPELLNINYQTTKDWMHMNGLDYNANLDQISFSSHALNELYVIDHSTTSAQAATHAGGNSGKGGDLLYRWGNPAAYSATGTNIFHTVHDAHFVPEDCPHAGDLVGYNNNGISNNQSCVDRVKPPRNGYNYTITAGSAYLPSTYTQRHVCNGHNNNMGNSQNLPNGNILVCVAQSGLIYEADSNGNTIWSKTIAGTVPQAFRYSACYVSGNNPVPTPIISQSGNVLTASTNGASYIWYLNGTVISGATNQSYAATQSGTYQVQVKDANGCISTISVEFAYINTGIATEYNSQAFQVFPNPTTSALYLAGTAIDKGNYSLYLYDVYGKGVLTAQNTAKLEVGNLPNGVYYLTLKNGNNQSFTQKIVIIQ